jgi:hypothetical protein
VVTALPGNRSACLSVTPRKQYFFDQTWSCEHCQEENTLRFLSTAIASEVKEMVLKQHGRLRPDCPNTWLRFRAPVAIEDAQQG